MLAKPWETFPQATPSTMSMAVKTGTLSVASQTSTRMMKEATGLIRAAAYKKRVEVQNQDTTEAGLDAVRTLVFQAMAKERPDLYAEVTKFLAAKKAEGLE